MRYLNEQAQLFLAASLMMVVACGALYLALGLYGMALDRFLKQTGLTAAFIEFIQEKRNRNKPWMRWAKWYDETFSHRDDMKSPRDRREWHGW